MKRLRVVGRIRLAETWIERKGERERKGRKK